MEKEEDDGHHTNESSRSLTLLSQSVLSVCYCYYTANLEGPLLANAHSPKHLGGFR